MLAKRILRSVLVVLDAFLALTAVAGGIGLLTGANAPPLELLQGSPFGSYTIPGLALLVIVGGCALAAALWTWRRHAWGAPASGLAGLVIIGFEIVEVLAIGSPPGMARSLQVFYFTLGLLILVLAVGLWLSQREATVEA